MFNHRSAFSFRFRYHLISIGLWGLSGGRDVGSTNSAQHAVQQAITGDLRRVRDQVEDEAAMLSVTSRDVKDKGQRLMFLFQRDLMPVSKNQLLP